MRSLRRSVSSQEEVPLRGIWDLQVVMDTLFQCRWFRCHGGVVWMILYQARSFPYSLMIPYLKNTRDPDMSFNGLKGMKWESGRLSSTCLPGVAVKSSRFRWAICRLFRSRDILVWDVYEFEVGSGHTLIRSINYNLHILRICICRPGANWSSKWSIRLN